MRRGADRVRRAVPPRLAARARRALHPQRRARPGRATAAPTASTSARTTCRSPRPASGRRRRRAGRALDPLARAVRRGDSADGDARPDQISVGPVWETPTKEGRPAAGLELIEHAARPTRRCPGSRSAASTPATSREVAPRGRRGSSWCARSGTPRDPADAARALRARLQRRRSDAMRSEATGG